MGNPKADRDASHNDRAPPVSIEIVSDTI